MGNRFIKMDLPKITANKKKDLKAKGTNRKPRLIACQICGKPFMTDQPNKRYCSYVCAEAAKRIKRAKWEQAHQ